MVFHSSILPQILIINSEIKIVYVEYCDKPVKLALINLFKLVYYRVLTHLEHTFSLFKLSKCIIFPHIVLGLLEKLCFPMKVSWHKSKIWQFFLCFF